MAGLGINLSDDRMCVYISTHTYIYIYIYIYIYRERERERERFPKEITRTFDWPTQYSIRYIYNRDTNAWALIIAGKKRGWNGKSTSIEVKRGGVLSYFPEGYKIFCAWNSCCRRYQRTWHDRRKGSWMTAWNNGE